jgi:dTDP-glucose 4,6-dehydratase
MYIDDFIPTLANACENFIDGEIINIGGTEYRSVRDLHDIIVKETGNDMAVIRKKDWHNVVNKRPNVEKAIKLLKHNPKTPLEEGIKKTVEWMKEVYKI